MHARYHILCSIIALPLFLTSCEETIEQPKPSIISNETVGRTTYKYVVAESKAVQILWKDDKGQPIKTFKSLKEHCERQGVHYIVAMNGGIFEPDRSPTGLLVQNRHGLAPLNLSEGYGNFFLKPNGVFYITKDKAKVIETSLYREASKRDGDVHFATQSGPLLVWDSKIHPAFNKNSKSRKLRNGVGILDDGNVIFAISTKDSDEQPNLYEFASFFMSKGCRNALYLDGTISEFRTSEDKTKENKTFSSFIVIEDLTSENFNK